MGDGAGAFSGDCGPEPGAGVGRAAASRAKNLAVSLRNGRRADRRQSTSQLASGTLVRAHERPTSARQAAAWHGGSFSARGAAVWGRPQEFSSDSGHGCDSKVWPGAARHMCSQRLRGAPPSFRRASRRARESSANARGYRSRYIYVVIDIRCRCRQTDSCDPSRVVPVVPTRWRDLNDQTVDVAPAPSRRMPRVFRREFEPLLDAARQTSSLARWRPDLRRDTSSTRPRDLSHASARLRGAHLQGLGFLDWDPKADHVPAGEADIARLERNFGDLVSLAGEAGCGYEAPLEAWYRFLIDPAPPQQTVVDNLVSRPQGIDRELLAQRAQFLSRFAGGIIISRRKCCPHSEWPRLLVRNTTLVHELVGPRPRRRPRSNSRCCRSVSGTTLAAAWLYRDSVCRGNPSN